MARLGLALFTVLLSARCALAVLSPTTGFRATKYDLQLDFGSTIDITKPVTGKVIISAVAGSAGATSLVMHWGSSLLGLTNDLPLSSEIVYSLVEPTTETPGTAVTSVLVDATTETITITLPTAAGNTPFITINFRVKINSDMRGLFARTYTNSDSSTSTFIATYLRPTYARHLFPCFDQPDFQATVTLRIIGLTGTVVVSSLSAPAPTAATSTTTTVFTGTAAMPTFALSFFLSTDMVSVGPTNSRSLSKVRFYFPKGTTATTVQSSVDYLTSYYYRVEDLVGFGNPLQTLSVVMLPNLDMPFAGFGIIFIRAETYANSYSTPQSEGSFRSLVVPVVHEFFRQFTEFSTRPNNWVDAWLPNALATYLKYTLFKNEGASFDLAADLEVVGRQTALALDSPTSNPLSLATSTSLNIDNTVAVLAWIMDPLKGMKGAFLLNMFDQSFPEGTVLAAIKFYLSFYKQASVDRSVFVGALRTAIITRNPTLSTGTATAAATTDLDLWFTTAGYTQVTAGAITASTATVAGSVPLALTVFCGTASCTGAVPGYSVAATVGSKSDSRYNNTRQDIWLTTSGKADLTIAAGDWLVANARSNGYYRANYTEDDWTKIIAALAAADNQILGRTQIIDDAFALAFTNKLADFSIPLKLAVANPKEPMYRNWYPVSRGLAQIRDRVWDSAADLAKYETFAKGLLQNVNTLLEAKTLDPYQQAKISSLFFAPFCNLSIGTYRTDAANNLTSFLSGAALPTTIPSSSYDALVCCGAAHGSLVATALWTAITTATNSYDTRRYNAIALGCLPVYDDIAKTMTTALASTDTTFNPFIKTTMWNVVQNYPAHAVGALSTNAASLQAKVGPVVLADMITVAGSKLNTVAQASALSGLTTTTVDQTVVAAASAVTTAVQARVTWLASYKSSLVTTLGSTTSSATTTVLSLMLLVPVYVIMLAS